MSVLYRKSRLLRRSRVLWGSLALWRPRLIFWFGACAIGIISVGFARLADLAQRAFAGITASGEWGFLLPLVVTPLGFMTVINTIAEEGPIAEAEALNDKLAGLDLAGRLSLVSGLGGRVVFTTSLGIEDQVITAEIGTHRLPIDIATLQTGRLFAETLSLIAETESQYDVKIQRYEPEKADIDAYAAQYGLNGFYESVEARHERHRQSPARLRRSGDLRSL